MIKIIKTLNLNRQTTSILENAYNIGYEKEVNALWHASFSLPLNDPKVSKVELLKYVEITDGDEYIGLFRIIPKHTTKSETTNQVHYECEHVLATLLDSSLFQYHQLSNYTTDYVLDYLLGRQNHKHWKKGQNDFKRYFHYGWENENVLSSIFSVPKPFDEPYIWEHDTQSYPWTLDLVKPDNKPICRIKEGYNLIDFEIEENPMSSYNRIFPIGAGEGVNQLTIEDVNGGIPYLEDRAPGEEIREYIWADKRFTDGESLKASAAALLNKWKEPIVTWKISAVDLSSITGLSIDKFKVGKVVRLQLDDYPTLDLRIMKETKSDIKGAPGNVQLEIGNVVEDLSTTETDTERRQQINELYSQGATNMLNTDRTDNADPEHPIKFKIRIPEDAININFMELTWDTDYFRGYTKGSKSGGHYEKASTVQSKSTSDGGAFVKESVVQSESTSDGGGQTTTDGGGQTSSAGGDHRHLVFKYDPSIVGPPAKNRYSSQNGMVEFNGSDGDLYTYGSSGDHTHKVSDHSHKVSDHTHKFSVTIPKIVIPKHAHEFNVTIPAIKIPDHEHEQIYGIYEHDKKPSELEIKVDGNVIPETSLSGSSIDLTDYLSKDSNGKIQRGRFAVVEIRPTDELAQISANIIWGLFIQSHKGGKF